MMPSDAFIFDLEGVIIDTEQHWDAVQATMLARRGHIYDRDTLKPALSGLGGAAAVDVIRTRYAIEDSAESLLAERNDLFRARLGGGVPYVPGFVDFLAGVCPSVPRCVATSMAADLVAIADGATGFAARVGGRVYTPESVGNRSKPAPDLFLHSAERLGVPAERCLVFEDSPHGIEAARRAGMRCVALATTYPAALLTAADHVVSGWHQLSAAAVRPVTG
jgi:beta-phosphoglucomutase-like phosphatase (HAD superfamily)